MQDVTELRRRDRQIMSKDATIREIHHRVKNNLQTVAALLRLQARRTRAPEAKVALEESMRRVASIALVHETLSGSIDEQIDFDSIVDRLLGMLADVMGARERDPRSSRDGQFGDIPVELATTMVLVHHRAGAERARARVPGRARRRRCVVRARRGARRADGDGRRQRHRAARPTSTRTGRSAGAADRPDPGDGRTVRDVRAPAASRRRRRARPWCELPMGRKPRVGG